MPWRAIAWSVPVVLLMLPLVAGAPWTLSDYVFAGLVFGSVGALLELAVRASSSPFYRAGVAVGVAGAFLLVWINAAVGIIGSEDDAANLMFVGVLAVVTIGAVIARGQAGGMARVMAATAAVQLAIGATALVAGLGASEPPGRWGILALNGGFVALFLASAWLFHLAARRASAR